VEIIDCCNSGVVAREIEHGVRVWICNWHWCFSSMRCSGRRSASVTVPAASLSGTVQVVSSKRRVLLASVHFLLEGSRVHARVTLLARVDTFIGNSAKTISATAKG